MHPSRVRLAQQRRGCHPEPEGQNLHGARFPAAPRQTELEWLGTVDDRLRAGEVPKAAQELAIGKGLVSVVHLGRSGQSQWTVSLTLATHPDAVPGIARVASVAACRPARHIPGTPGNWIDRPLFWHQVHGLPVRVIEAGLGPQRLAGFRIDGRVADGEPPGSI